MTPGELVERLSALNPQALLLEPRSVYDRALVGITESPQDDWPRESAAAVAVYDADACVGALMDAEGWDSAQALEWFHFNTAGSWAGEGTPTFR